MARMIPAFTDDRTPPGERDVYSMLAGGPDDWVSLHSLDLAPWNRGLRTEIDFVVIVPDAGIVCIEVKSHNRIAFEDDRWVPVDIKRSPFKQAADARYMFYRRLRELAPQFRHLPVIHCCIFPRASFDLRPNLAVQAWELVDARLFRTFRNGTEFCSELKRRMLLAINADATLQKLDGRLSKLQVEEIAGYCVPVQKRRPDAREEIRHREQEIERVLREQQKPVLQLSTLNERLIVSGGAGTGKTLIAMEVACRAAEQGRRVALLCFNQLVGDWIRHRIDQLNLPMPNLVVGRAIKIMAEMTGIQIPEKPSQEYWENDLLAGLEERLTDPDFREMASFDFLVLDEAQDLLARPRLWHCLSQFITGGVTSGSFALFGDFEHQVLADKNVMDQTMLALETTARPCRWRLSENCRNYRIVGDTAIRLTGFDSDVYSDYRRTGGGVNNYDICFYSDDSQQLGQIRRWLAEFKVQGYKPSEIALLSFCADDFSAAGRLRNEGLRLQAAWQAGDGTVFTSISAFKGMERKVVILTDVNLNRPDFHRQLFYTGMTRATETIRILCDKNSQSVLLGWLSEKEMS
jgi:cell division protein ZapA (FtsZ GTPase activity inhibitor)